MVTTEIFYVGNGSTVIYNLPFPFIDRNDVKVEVNNSLTSAFTFVNNTTIQFNVAPTNGATIRIFRQTFNDTLISEFFPGSSIKAVTLNNNFLQILYSAQEVFNRTLSLSGGIMRGILNMGGFRITNLGTPSSGSDAATKAYADLKVTKAGDTMTGQLAMSGNRVVNVGDPVNLQDVATKGWASNLAFTGVNLPDFQFDGGFANSTYGGTFLFIDGGNA
jgi:hypothetical protein